MTVTELIKQLSAQDPDVEVAVRVKQENKSYAMDECAIWNVSRLGSGTIALTITLSPLHYVTTRRAKSQ